MTTELFTHGMSFEEYEKLMTEGWLKAYDKAHGKEAIREKDQNSQKPGVSPSVQVQTTK